MSLIEFYEKFQEIMRVAINSIPINDIKPEEINLLEQYTECHRLWEFMQ